MRAVIRYIQQVFQIALFVLCLGAPKIAEAQFTPTPPLPTPIQELIEADTSAMLYIDSVVIVGNRKTKKYIIEREMQLHQGDSILSTQLAAAIHQSRSLVYNTTLFTSVFIIPFLTEGRRLRLEITVKEKWYIYPSPQFQLVDRNWNDWIKTYDASLDRVVYGLKFAHYNLSGRRDKLNIYLLNGYSRNISFSYSAPYSNRSLTEGFSASAGYTENREIAYKTSADNKQMQVSEGRFVRQNFTVGGSYTKRTGYYRRRTFAIGYTFSSVADTIITEKYNPAYFNSSKPYQNYPDFTYSFQYTDVDNVAFPLEGIHGGYLLHKRGLGLTGGINAFTVEGSFSRFLNHGRNWYSSMQLMAKVKLPFDQAYINQRAFGFGDYFLRGLEYYVIDGPASGLGRFTLKRKVVSFAIPFPFKWNIISEIPFSIYIKGYGDVGYSYNTFKYKAMLNNRFLYTAGFGLDILSLYDINLRIEYSFNQLNENGLFLHSRGGF